MPPRAVTAFEPTPNPDAMKFVLARPAPPASGAIEFRSYASAAAARSDPLAQRLLAIPGVRSVLITDAWLTIVRTPGTPWEPIKKGVEAALDAQPPPVHDR